MVKVCLGFRLFLEEPLVKQQVPAFGLCGDERSSD